MRSHHRPGFEETLEGPADGGAVVGRDAMAGPAVRAVHPHLEGGSLRRAGSAEVRQLEAEPGHMLTDQLK